MGQDEKSVDIEAIIAEIKEDISANYSKQEILAFEPVDYSTSLVYLNPTSAYDELCLEDRLTACVNDQRVEWNRNVKGTGISATVMKAIKRFTRFMIAPIVEDQNRFNGDVTITLMQMKFKMERLEAENEALREELDKIKGI